MGRGEVGERGGVERSSATASFFSACELMLLEDWWVEGGGDLEEERVRGGRMMGAVMMWVLRVLGLGRGKCVPS